ncbi:MAG: serine hydrolase [Proteobacteria bacterium]|nr:serine hydrolase [Pseudomonadota bacterium]
MNRLLLCVALAACTHHASPAPSPLHDPLEATIDRLANAAIAGRETAGMSIAIARDGQLAFAKGYGHADIGGQRMASPTTIYRIGSLTKQFTAAAIVQLAEAGKLGLDDDVTKYVPVPTGGNPVTITQLLHHTSGMPNYTDLRGFDQVSTKHLTPMEIVALVKDTPWLFAPGTKWSYSNTGYVVLGMVIEKLSGESYAHYLMDHVFPRAGLTSTTYCDESRPDRQRAQGYEPAAAGTFKLAKPLDLSVPYAAGSICSTVEDLVRWTAALAMGKVVSPAGYHAMTTSHGLAGQAPYGFGLQLQELKGHAHVFHNGGINGFVSELHTYPTDRITIVVLTNTESPLAPTIEKSIARVALALPSEAVAIAARELPAFAGTYATPGIGDVVIAVEGDHLTVAPPGQAHYPLEYRGSDRFAIVVVDAILAFARDPDTHAVLTMTIEQGGQTIVGTKATP